MPSDSIDVFCPACNILVSAVVHAEANVGYRSDAISELDTPDAPYRSEHYTLAFCRRCNGAFLIRQSLYGIPAEFETVTDEAILFPTSDRLALSDVPDSVRKAHEQAIRAFGSSLYEPAALMCRKALEAICKLKAASGKSLFDRLSALHKEGIIDGRLLEWAHEIRLVGNDAAHDSDLDVSKDDARDVLDLTEAIILYVFSLTARFERFRLRRTTPDMLTGTPPTG